MTLPRHSAGFLGRTARGFVSIFCAASLVWGNAALLAQEPPPAQNAAGQEPDAPKLTPDQLDALVAPIALYPDPLLSQALVASTYPLELLQAAQWLSKNSSLKGDALTEAVQKEDWDPSVQATAAIPDLLKRMTEDIDWTTNLGNAFLDQQADVMESVQRLRKKAKDSGKLESSEQQKVTTKEVEYQSFIEIEPTDPEVVYVPSYSPSVIWGVGMYPYPPIYYPPYYPGAPLYGFGVGIAIGIGISGGWGWGCGWGGGNNTININNNNNYVSHHNQKNNRNPNARSSAWQHDGAHRGGAPYGNRATANQYGGGARGGEARSGTGGGSFGGASGGDRVGNRSVPSGASSYGGGSAFGGSNSSAGRANQSSTRGSSSMGSRGGGMSRGGGGRRR